jgi:hypothetical protein
VQVGDVLDRGDDELAILAMLEVQVGSFSFALYWCREFSRADTVAIAAP